MNALQFKKWNTILGWIAFAVALTTYSLTVEPTLSFWDCGEYISTAAKLEVGHPPGAPLYQMMGAFFSTFAPSADKIALMVNLMSVFSSAFTVLFMFWSLTLLLRKILSYEQENNDKQIMILGSSFIGTLTFTFSDTFWYNAVEAEVYAMATLLISVLVWLGLKWEQDLNLPRGNKWLLLIALVLGLSFGVHFMALLTIPSIGLLYFFKKYEKVTAKNFIVANVVVIVVLFFVFKYLLPYTLSFFGKTEIFMVNTFGLPFNSGTIIAFLLIISFFYFSLSYTRKKGMVLYNTILLTILLILVGFSTWLMLPIRANTDIPINENKPSDAAEVLAYYNREQYGEQKTFYGPFFTEEYANLDDENPYKDEKPNFERNYQTGKYEIVNNFVNANQNWDDKHKGFLPRMWSRDHAENYMIMTEPVDFSILPEFAEEQELVDIVSEFRNAYNAGKVDLDDYNKFLKTYGQYLVVERPSFVNNMKFMFEYQFGYMFGRYLLWNFVGRQNDVQGKYDENGNVITGIPFVDTAIEGNQEKLTSDMKNNKARNAYFALPLIIGLFGMYFHAKRDLKSFYVFLVLFLFNSLALKIFLNERPFEPRERDYAVIGAFFTYAIWVGIGVYAIYAYVKTKINTKLIVPVTLITTLICSPLLMAKENWDDHDRSGKYTALAMAKSYLDSCEENAILYTIGDNDTFPLWYVQEIEGYRTDVRIVNTSLLQTDWYIDQMKNKAYLSEPLPISFKREQYVGSNRDGCLFEPDERVPYMELKDFLDFLKLEDDRALIEMKSGQKLHFYPTNKIVLPIDKETIVKNKVVSEKYYDSIVPAIEFTIKGGALYKNNLIMLDILQNNNWKRPIYFTGGSFGDEDYLWMKDYLQLDGMCYKLVPVKTNRKEGSSPLDLGYIDSDKMYARVMKWDWGNSGNPKIYHDTETRRNSITYRTNLARLVETLINENKNDKAEKVIDLAMQKMPVAYFGYYSFVEPFVEGYYEIGKPTKARKIIQELLIKYQESLTYYNSLNINEQSKRYYDIYNDLDRYKGLLEMAFEAKDNAFYNKEKVTFNKYNALFKQFEKEMLP